MWRFHAGLRRQRLRQQSSVCLQLPRARRCVPGLLWVCFCWPGRRAGSSLHTTGWLHVTQITVKSPHAQSFQLLNNTKQTVTYFRSREQATEKMWSGIVQAGGVGEEPGGGGASSGLARGWDRAGRGRGLARGSGPGSVEKHVSCRVRSRRPRHGFPSPANVIKQAGTRILQQPLSWRPPGTRNAVHRNRASHMCHTLDLGNANFPTLHPPPSPLHSCYFLPFVWYRAHLARR